MFLNSLRGEQKSLFIELAIKAAEAGGSVTFEQKYMLKCFAVEMNITPIYKTDRDTDDIIDSLMAVSSEKELRIILFEILGIIVSDTGLGGKEKMFAEHFAGRCKIDPGLVDKMAGLLTDYADVYQDITSLDL